jgi:hypothetical protein
MTDFEYLSLFLGADPCVYLQGIDRQDWMQRIVPLSIRLVVTVAHALPL